jgi:hypothetical protein
MEPSNAASNGRTPQGTFAPGNTLGRGNPNLKKMHALRGKLLGAVDDDAMERVSRKLLEMAEAGDLDAIRTLLAYTIGKPPASLAITGPDGESLGVDTVEMQAVILSALASHPEAKVAVAGALLRLRRSSDDGRHDDAGAET